ncbi:MAG: hypothetical protein C5B47_04880 [Verrucomicrobia bacterium]|nr:MAG: hypothetical protein C5B47_04880 [Verrucomicrobiota bacterium]
MNSPNIRTLLQNFVDQGGARIGQLEFTRDLRLFHKEDAGRSDLRLYQGADAAREIAQYDEKGEYRPLKSAPNLRRGWELEVTSIEELHLALDFFYPAALGLWLAFLENRLISTPLRQTLERQSGMYRVTAKLTDLEARDLMRNLCQVGCLRQRRWSVMHSREMVLPSHEIPLICSEACHLFISAARRIVKARK